MRKMATIRRIKKITPISGADNIELAEIGGWCVVVKKEEFKENEQVVYCEIDSWIPTELAPFLSKNKEPSEYNGIKGEKLSTRKFRGQISQGLVLPISILEKLHIKDEEYYEGIDVSDLLNIEKYEPPIPAQISGDCRSFSWPISKTDEVRVQADEGLILISNLSGQPYYISLKLDGTSCSFIIDPSNSEFHVCGRNYSYKKNPDHSFWAINERYQIEQRLRSIGGNLALQGECVGPGIQQNKLGLSHVDYYIFNIVDTATRQKLPLEDSLGIAKDLNMNFVPILEQGNSFNYDSAQLLEKAKGKYRDHFASAKLNQDREGIVIRSVCNTISFKAINNEFLLKEN